MKVAGPPYSLADSAILPGDYLQRQALRPARPRAFKLIFIHVGIRGACHRLRLRPLFSPLLLYEREELLYRSPILHQVVYEKALSGMRCQSHSSYSTHAMICLDDIPKAHMEILVILQALTVVWVGFTPRHVRAHLGLAADILLTHPPHEHHAIDDAKCQ